jgi:adenosylhomocysteine nucleosidase
MTWVTAVVGLAFEARIAAGPGIRVICSGNGRNLPTLLAKLKDCRGLISFGVAGGLSPDLRPGTCVVGSAIVSGTKRFVTHRGWSQSVLETIPDAVHGEIAGVSAPVAHPDDKRALHLDTGAIAVDMESHIVASAAAERGIPMAAIRVITDPAHRTLPKTALAAMRQNGTIDIISVISSVVKHPFELPALLRIARDAAAARTALRHGRRVLGSSLGFSGIRKNELDLVYEGDTKLGVEPR